jgi:hypothetical protein
MKIRYVYRVKEQSIANEGSVFYFVPMCDNKTKF